jgi:sugar phosphate isomerase/epimerase
VQREIVHAAYAQDTHARESRADAIHERAARGTEVVGHGVVLARGFYENSARLTEGLQVVAAAQVLQVRVVNGEVGCVHGRGEFVAVGAVADEGADETRAMGWLRVWRWYESRAD